VREEKTNPAWYEILHGGEIEDGEDCAEEKRRERHAEFVKHTEAMKNPLEFGTYVEVEALRTLLGVPIFVTACMESGLQLNLEEKDQIKANTIFLSLVNSHYRLLTYVGRNVEEDVERLYQLSITQARATQGEFDHDKVI
jgi:hypothetical protein